MWEEGERGKELLVIVMRGRAANIAEPDGPMLYRDIREWAHGMTWAEIRRLRIDPIPVFVRSEDVGFYEFLAARDEGVETDSYKEVDEYAWNPVD